MRDDETGRPSAVSEDGPVDFAVAGVAVVADVAVVVVAAAVAAVAVDNAGTESYLGSTWVESSRSELCSCKFLMANKVSDKQEAFVNG